MEANLQVEAETLELPESGLESLKTLAIFLLPTLGIWIVGPLLSVVDTIAIGQATQGAIQLAALGPATVICDYLGFIFIAAFSTTITGCPSVSVSLRASIRIGSCSLYTCYWC